MKLGFIGLGSSTGQQGKEEAERVAYLGERLVGPGYLVQEGEMKEFNALVIDPRDNVAVVLEDIPKGGLVRLADGESLPATEDIPCSHKVALVDLPSGAEVVKYGEVIGKAAGYIARGSWVHTHNLVLEE